jgi:hypothetical protein
LRNAAPAHKRLMLMGTLYITDAGFARLFGDGVHKLLGSSAPSFMASAYLSNDILFLALGAYDLVTRRRLHPVYIAGMAWVAALQLLATWAYFNPAWKPIATHLIGH